MAEESVAQFLDHQSHPYAEAFASIANDITASLCDLDHQNISLCRQASILGTLDRVLWYLTPEGVTSPMHPAISSKPLLLSWNCTKRPKCYSTYLEGYLLYCLNDDEKN
jgi:hypothetical protein